jgi:tRNA-splicing endonuclease subunit Sen34
LFLKSFQGAAVLVDDPKAHLQPTISQLERWSKEQKDSIQTHLAYTESKTAKESANASQAMSEEAQRKRKERELRKQAEAARKTAAGEDVNNPAALLASASTESQENPTSRITDSKMGTSLPEGSNTSSIPYTIVIPASSSSLEWYDSGVGSYSTIEAAREAGVWDYPSDLTERARCGAFKDLWKQGYFMGGGIKFGGEYLVYPGIYCFITLYSTVLPSFFSSGDPLRYHSHFTATVIESPIAFLRPMEIVAHGRLGTATKKAHLLCGWDDEKKEVSYLSIEWSGFG